MSTLQRRRAVVALMVIVAASVIIGGVVAAPRDGNAPGSLPVVISTEKLKRLTGGTAPAISAVAAHPNGRRVYLGRQYSYDIKRLNLFVMTLDGNGKTVGEARPYRDTELPLPEGAHSSIIHILVDATLRKLYLSYAMSSATPFDVKEVLSVYDLNDEGEPIGKPRSYDTGNPHKSLAAMTRHPRLNLLYMVGFGGSAVYVYQLDNKGEPQGKPKEFPVGGHGKFEVAISLDGKHLYLGTYPDLLEVFDLDDAGMPTGQARTFTAGKEQAYLRFQYSPRALYLIRQTEDGPRLGVWPLQGNGDPQGTPEVREDIALSALAVDAARNRVWIGGSSTFKDAFSGKTITEGVAPVALTSQPNGSVAVEKSYPAAFRQAGVASTVAADGMPVLVTQAMPSGVLGNRIKDYYLRVTLVEARLGAGTTPDKLPVAFNINNKQATSLGELAPGQSSKWASLDDYLKDQQGPLLASISAGNIYADPLAPTSVAKLKLKLEVAQGDPDAGGRVLKTMTDTVLGTQVLMLIPGYAYEPPEERLAALESVSEHAQKYLTAARAAGLKPEERPKQFMVSCYHLMGGQGSVEQLKTQAEALSLLGFNTASVYAWGGIPP